MNDCDIVNAKISKVTISMADHGCLTFTVFLEGAGWGCGYGGYCIGTGYLGADEDDFTAESGDGLVAMMRIMDVVGVERWEDMQGRYVRCKLGRLSDGVLEIGHIMHNKWFNLREFFAERVEKK